MGLYEDSFSKPFEAGIQRAICQHWQSSNLTFKDRDEFPDFATVNTRKKSPTHEKTWQSHLGWECLAIRCDITPGPGSGDALVNGHIDLVAHNPKNMVPDYAYELLALAFAAAKVRLA